MPKKIGNVAFVEKYGSRSKGRFWSVCGIERESQKKVKGA